MENGAIIPYRQVVLIPLDPNLQVIVWCNGFEEIVLDKLAFSVSNVINPAVFNLLSRTKDTLPTRDWVRPNDGMYGLEVRSSVFWCSSVFLDEFDSFLCNYFVERRLEMSRCQTLEKILPRGRKAVVCVVTRSKECISAYFSRKAYNL